MLWKHRVFKYHIKFHRTLDTQVSAAGAEPASTKLPSGPFHEANRKAPPDHERRADPGLVGVLVLVLVETLVCCLAYT